MKAGRELDALIAVKVMGWELKFVGAPSYVWTEIETGLGRAHEDHWSPSTSIHYAWQVVEKIVKGGVPIPNKSGHFYDVCMDCCWTIQDGACSEVRGTSSMGYVLPDGSSIPDMDYVSVWAETAPLAICLAALKAVGVEVEP